MTIDLTPLRRQFPSLEKVVNGKRRIFLDGAGGTQVPQSVINAMVEYLVFSNANYGGLYDTSISTDRLLTNVREAVCDFINGRSWDEVLIGPNMTTLTFALAWAVSRRIKPGDKVVVSRLGHGGNIDAWRALAHYGAVVEFIELVEKDCTLDYEQARRAITPGTKIVSLEYASNATGTVHDVGRLAKLAHAVGAWLFVDAVHMAPHLPIDVQAVDADFLACSAYKFFGPHVGFLWGRKEILESLEPFRPWPDFSEMPSKYVLGTPNMEGLAGAVAAIEYLADVGREYGSKFEARYSGKFSGRRLQLKKGMAAIGEYELGLSGLMNEGLKKVPGLTVWGITDAARLAQRCPTYSFQLSGFDCNELCRRFNEHGIFVWNGMEGFGALEFVKHFHLIEAGGLLRVCLEHYNTAEEIQLFLRALETMKGG